VESVACSRSAAFAEVAGSSCLALCTSTDWAGTAMTDSALAHSKGPLSPNCFILFSRALRAFSSMPAISGGREASEPR
jgi:hypothetical protein